MVGHITNKYLYSINVTIYTVHVCALSTHWVHPCVRLLTQSSLPTWNMASYMSFWTSFRSLGKDCALTLPMSPKRATRTPKSEPLGRALKVKILLKVFPFPHWYTRINRKRQLPIIIISLVYLNYGIPDFRPPKGGPLCDINENKK